MKKILLVAGARPNFMKIAPLMREFKKNKAFKPILVHTGQHYDYEMSQSFFDDLDIQKPDYFLGVGSGTHAVQTAKTMIHFEEVCLKEKPALVVVVGDVNSTLACSITAKKLQIKVAHVEAGLRSFDMTMPEEVNRMVTDSISDFLFITEKTAKANLKKEGKGIDQVFFTGNIMIDSLFYGIKKLNRKCVGVDPCVDPFKFKIENLKKSLAKYGVVTLHRPSNVDDKNELAKIVRVLNKTSKKLSLIFPLHPRTKKNLKAFGLKLDKNIYVTEPLGYLEFLYLYKDAACMITDSGGLQEETTVLKIPCFTLRMNTERPITIEQGTNILIAGDYQKFQRKIEELLDGKSKQGRIPPYWDGKTALRIANRLKKII